MSFPLNLTTLQGFYLEFYADQLVEHFVESTFVIFDTGCLTGKSNHVFASKYASLFLYFDLTGDTASPSAKFCLPQKDSRSRKAKLHGWIYGIKFKHIVPNPLGYLSNEDLKSISQMHSAGSKPQCTTEMLNGVLLSICKLLCKRLPPSVLDEHAYEGTYSPCSTMDQSERTMRRRFIRQTGLSPKPFFSLTRFHSSLISLIQNSDSLIDIALDHAFSDQSHFSRDFSQRAGIAPRKFRGTWIDNNDVHFIQESDCDASIRFGLTVK